LISRPMCLFECWYNFLMKLKHIISVNDYVSKEWQINVTCFTSSSRVQYPS
jgi:hypothetical protein